MRSIEADRNTSHFEVVKETKNINSRTTISLHAPFQGIQYQKNHRRHNKL